ncbi:PaaI family thioesterase [Altererythrobacter litoralis]|uniref:PaaI family thioesterase n=1 Tax=Altererythrobacter litoralis TaxID=3113904 RepID=A0ABU7GD97_9SPHN|nr:PaaI family thioesterase [Erythrobacteraceae bacterium 1XM1-14]
MSEAAHTQRHALNAAHAELLGVEFDSFDREREEITLRFRAPDSFITPRGSVQGGLIAEFLDEVMGWAHVWATDHAEAPLNLDINMTILKPVLAGALVGKGRVIRRGRRAIFLEGELFDPAGTLLARATSTAIPTPRPGS